MIRAQQLGQPNQIKAALANTNSQSTFARPRSFTLRIQLTYASVALLMIGGAAMSGLAATWRLRRIAPGDALRA